MDSPTNNVKTKLVSTFRPLKLGIILSLDKNKVHHWLTALSIPVFLLGPILGLVLCYTIITSNWDDLLLASSIASVCFVLPFWFVALLGVLYSFNSTSGLSYDQIYVKGFKLLLPLLWLAVLNIFIIFIGLCLFIIPGVIWGMRYSLSIGALIFEDKRGFQALSRSKALTKKHFLYLIINYAACGAVIFFAFEFVLFFSEPQFGLWMIVRLFIFVYALTLASAIYYCTFQQLSTQGQFTIAEGLSRAKDADTKEVIMVGIVLLIFYIVVHLKVWLSD